MARVTRFRESIAARIPPLTALLLFFALTALYVFGDHPSYDAIMRFWGVPIGSFGPFVDMRAVTTAWECHRLGIGVIQHNPCDPLGRPFSYSPLWLMASSLRFDGRSADALAWGCDLLFLLSLLLLPTPKRTREAVVLLLATSSTMVGYAVERANIDIIIFLLVVLTGFLALRSSWTRVAAYFVALLAGLLKYYPLALLSVTLRERLPRFLAINVAALAFVALFVVLYLSDLEKGLPLVPVGAYFTDLFAAKNLPFGVAHILSVISGGPSAPLSPLLPLFRVLAYGLYALLALSCAAICVRVTRLSDFRPALTSLRPTESMFLLIGSVLIVACFFAGQSIGYRGIFLLLVLPGLLALSRNASDKSVRILGGGTSLLILFLMWGEFFRAKLPAAAKALGASDGVAQMVTFAFWFFREMAWWWAVGVMAAVVLHFLSEAGVGLALSSALTRRGAGARNPLA